MATLGDIVVNLRMNHGAFSSGARAARGDLRGISSAAGSLSPRLTQSSRSLDGLASSLITVAGKAAAVTGAAYAAATAIEYLAAASNELTRSLTTSTAIQEVNADQFGRMREEALRLARDSSIKDFAPDLARGYFYLASAGQTVEQQIGSLETVAQFATAGNFDLALATDLATDAQSALGLTVSDTSQNLENLQLVTDTLVRANTLANASVQQFSTSLTSGAGVAARQVEMDIAEVVSILAVFADQGIKDAEAGTQVGIVLRDLQTKALQNAAAFKTAGVEVFDASGSFNHIAEIVSDLEGRLDGLSIAAKKQALLDLGFSDKSVKAIQSLLGTSENLKRLYDQLNDVEGVVDRVASRSLSEMDQAAKRSAAQWSELKTRIGETLEPIAALKEEVKGDILRGLNASVKNFRDNLDRWFGGPKGQTVTITGVVQLEQNSGPRRAAEVAAETAAANAARMRAALEFDPNYTIDLTQLEKTGDTAAQAAKSLLSLKSRLWVLGQAFDDGNVSQENYAAASAHLLEQIDAATGGARAFADELERELDLLGAVAEQRKLADLAAAGAAPDELARVEALQGELAYGRELLKLNRELNELRSPGASLRDDLAAAGVTPEQMQELARKQDEINAAKHQQELQQRAEQLREQFATPADHLTGTLSELRTLERADLLGMDTLAPALEDARERFLSGLKLDADSPFARDLETLAAQFMSGTIDAAELASGLDKIASSAKDNREGPRRPATSSAADTRTGEAFSRVLAAMQNPNADPVVAEQKKSNQLQTQQLAELQKLTGGSLDQSSEMIA